MRAGRLLVSAAILLLAACGPQVRAPEVRLRSINTKSAGETVVGLDIFNPNRFPLHVQSVDYEVSVGERLCGRGRRSDALFLDASDTTLAEFPLAIDYSELLKSVPALFTDTVVSGVKGRYVVSTFFGRRQFGFSGDKKLVLKDGIESFLEGLFKD